MSFGIGSDTERTVVPKNILLLNNLFYNSKDSLLYNVYDSISEITIVGNVVSKNMKQQLVGGFIKTSIGLQMIADMPVPSYNKFNGIKIIDSLKEIEKDRLQTNISSSTGLSNAMQLNSIRANATGAKWFNVNKINIPKKTNSINCKSSIELIQILSKNNNENLIINLTGTVYNFNTPIIINQDITITSNSKQSIRFSTSESSNDFAIKINAGNSLSFINLQLNLSAINTNVFITTDTSGSANHSNFIMSGCSITNANKIFFKAAKSSVCDSIVVTSCTFSNNKETLFKLDEETDKKGYYNVEKFKITNCIFSEKKAQLLTIIRGGNDESTMGPSLTFSNNKITNCNTENNEALISNNGVQYSQMENNEFINCNTNKILIQFEDAVSAKHIFTKNKIENSGEIKANKFTEMNNNIIQ